MAKLVEVFSEFFRAFGYHPTLRAELEGLSGRRHPVPLVLDKDARRVAVTAWLHRQPLGPTFIQEFVDAVKDCACDGGLVVSLGPVPPELAAHASHHRIQVWDGLRTTQELGSAVLRETCPDAWEQRDPWTPPRSSRILDQVRAAAPIPVVETPGAPATVLLPTTQVPLPTTNEPTNEPPFPAAIPATLATAQTQAADTLQIPLAFGVLDQAVQAPPPAPPPPPTARAPIVAPVVALPSARPSRNVLRLQVNKNLAASLARAKVRSVDRLFLRLVPHHLFDYEASILVEGSLQAQKQTGRMAVDASLKRVRPWSYPLDVADFSAEGADVDEKPVRVAEDDARRLVVTELKTHVTRDVVLQEDDSEWSVVVKKKVSLAEEELKVMPLGVYWVPVWRASGKDGAIEIDAATGQVLFEELAIPKSDAQLI